MPLDQLGQPFVDLLEALFDRTGGIRLDHTTVQRGHLAALDPDHAKPEIGRPGIYTHNDSHPSMILARASDAFPAITSTGPVAI
jgi:hypothetical protein